MPFSRQRPQHESGFFFGRQSCFARGHPPPAPLRVVAGRQAPGLGPGGGRRLWAAVQNPAAVSAGQQGDAFG